MVMTSGPIIEAEPLTRRRLIVGPTVAVAMTAVQSETRPNELSVHIKDSHADGVPSAQEVKLRRGLKKE